VVHFRANQTGARAPRGRDHGEAAVDKWVKYSRRRVEGVQLGLTRVDRCDGEPDMLSAICPVASGKGPAGRTPTGLAAGDSIALPVRATVLTRFPGKEGRVMVENGG